MNDLRHGKRDAVSKLLLADFYFDPYKLTDRIREFFMSVGHEEIRWKLLS